MSKKEEFLGSVIEASKNLAKADSYIIALISETEYLEAPSCPHCTSRDGTVCLDEIMNLDNHIAELHMCQTCACLYIICGFPTLFEVAFPIFLHITIKDGENPIAEVVATDMAKEIMAQANMEKNDTVGVGD